MNKKNSVAICVLSFDGASELWQPFFDHFFQAWDNCPYNVYLLTNYIEFGHSKVTSVPIGEDVDWSSNLRKGLSIISEERILFIFDDFLLLKIDTSAAQKHISQFVKNDWPYLTLYPNNHRVKNITPNISRISEDGVYRCTLVYGLIKKNFLKNLLVDGESAWEFEINGGKRTNRTTLLSVDKKIFTHHHLLRKGVWMRPGYLRLKKMNYLLDTSRKVETFFEYLARETKEFIFRLYHRNMPRKLIEKLERRRN